MLNQTGHFYYHSRKNLKIKGHVNRGACLDLMLIYITCGLSPRIINNFTGTLIRSQDTNANATAERANNVSHGSITEKPRNVS